VRLHFRPTQSASCVLFTPPNINHSRQASCIKHAKGDRLDLHRHRIACHNTALLAENFTSLAIHSMPAVIGKKRKSEQASDATGEMDRQMIPTKRGDQPSNGSPMKKRRTGITLAQKQALIENLQLESTAGINTAGTRRSATLTLDFVVTERARKLRSNYNIHAQTLRTRVEIRVHRISRPLRNITMGELLQKYTTQQQQHKEAARGPPVPAKDSVVGQHAFR
jgi:hypothetical protein